MRSWLAVVPGEFHRTPWITNLDGTASPIDTITLHNRVFYYGEVCMPHNCAGNVVAFLAAKGGREAYGALAQMRSEFGIDILARQTRKRGLFLTRSWANNSTNHERAGWRLESQIKASTEPAARGVLNERGRPFNTKSVAPILTAR
jgi:hypothetical protein